MKKQSAINYWSSIKCSCISISFLPILLTAQTSEFNYATGNVSGHSYVGGLIGRIEGEVGRIADNYARGSVTGSFVVGGLAGSSVCTVERSYSTGKISGTLYTGGLMGWCIGSVKSSYWDYLTSGQLFSSCGAGRSSDDMTYPYAIDTYTGWDFNNIWSSDISPVQNGGYPMLRVSQVFKVSVQVFPPGSGKISGEGYYKANQPVFLEAEPNPSFSFTGWQKENKTISTQNQFYLPVTGNMHVVARFKSKATLIQTDRANPGPELLIWPNPVRDVIHVDLSTTGCSVSEISIINLVGQTLIIFKPVESEVRPFSFSVAGLKTGIYIVKVRLSATFVSGKFYKR
jgi:hypothetical protein